MATMDWRQFFKSHPHPAFRVLAGARFLERLQAGRGDGGCTEELRKAGELIIEQGKPAEAIYFVGEGKVSVYVFGPDRHEIRLATLGRGDFIGELSLLGEGDRPRSATVKAETDCTLLRIGAAEFREALHQHPDVFSELLLILSERLRRLAECVGEVAYQEVNNKLDLMSTKLDAELKAMNASLTASQTVFEQTTTWAHEVMAGSERFWNRVTVIGATLAALFTVLVGVGGWFGFQSFDVIKERADNATVRIERTAADVENIKKSAEETMNEALEIKQASQEITELRDGLLSGATVQILPNLIRDTPLYTVSTGRAKNPITRPAKALFSVALRVSDIAITTEIFRAILGALNDGLVSMSLARSVESPIRLSFQPLRDVLRVAIDKQDDKKVSPRDVALAYYFTLLSLVVEFGPTEDGAEEYGNTLKAFEYYRDKQEFYLTETEKRLFRPESIIFGVKYLGYIETNIKDKMIENIESAWLTLVPS